MNRSKAVVVLLALCLGGLAVASLAFGAARKKGTPSRPGHYARIVPACPVVPIAKDQPSPLPAPSKELLSALGVLRRDHTAADALPAQAAAALRARGATFNPATTRLLRTSRNGGKAWIVPVSDVHVLDVGGPCGGVVRLDPRTGDILSMGTVYRGGGVPGAVVPLPMPPPLPRTVTTVPATPALPRTVTTVPTTPTPAPARPSVVPPSIRKPPPPSRPSRKGSKAPRATRAASLARVMATMAAQRRALRERIRPAIEMPPGAPVEAGGQGPEEGIAVVSVRGAPAGGGGALDDVIRGRTRPEVKPFGVAGSRLMSVSGVVPDGVGSAFLTSPDGTAVKADVKDNAYSFIVAPLSRPEARYVVWLREGIPHVQAVTPVFAGGLWPPGVASEVNVTPGGFGGGPFSMAIAPAIRRMPAIPRRIPKQIPKPRG